ncbi:hypothetical protein Tco_0100358 [Tanacetum coccineum]
MLSVLDSKNKALSYAGRLQLIACVLASLHTYWAIVFLISKVIVRGIETILKIFLLSQGVGGKGKAKIAWKAVCTPKSEGGLGLKPIGPWNEVLLTKQIQNTPVKKDSLWVKWVNVVKLKCRSILEVQEENNDSCTWRTLLGMRSKVISHIIHKIENGRNTMTWHDNWNDYGHMDNTVSTRSLYDARMQSTNSG